MRLGGNIVAFEVKGGITGGQSFLNAIKMCSLSDNLGKSGTIVTPPFKYNSCQGCSRGKSHCWYYLWCVVPYVYNILLQIWVWL